MMFNIYPKLFFLAWSMGLLLFPFCWVAGVTGTWLDRTFDKHRNISFVYPQPVSLEFLYSSYKRLALVELPLRFP
jgi:hypothetical protein